MWSNEPAHARKWMNEWIDDADAVPIALISASVGVAKARRTETETKQSGIKKAEPRKQKRVTPSKANKRREQGNRQIKRPEDTAGEFAGNAFRSAVVNPSL